VSVFVAMAEKIVGDGGNGVALVENYRSTSAILSFANTLFCRVMDGNGTHALPPHVDTRHRIRYDERDHLQPGREFDDAGRVILVLGDEGQAADTGRVLEARAFAALIDELHEVGVVTGYRDA